MVTLRRVRAVDSATPVPAVVENPPAALASLRKRTTDVVVASALLLLSSPIWLIATVVIKLSSPGPILFRQRRVGLNGEEFVILKFRTMHVGNSDSVHRDLVTRMIEGDEQSAESDVAPGTYKLSSDARVIPGLRWLRKSSLDELPQLINVLRGEMSMVGPRPPLPYEVEVYRPWQMRRLAVRPGITGLWQVSGRNRLTYNEMCMLDVRYIETWSFAGDLGIMLRTPWVMFVDGGGAS